ncbi:MAG: DUF1835 domain-containing protein [Bacteroidota bacterium]|nr:DUF1835 domain-containing protein [Bacteroidota bacterium]
MQEYHILNGDALRNRFPAELNGKCITFRECFIDGPLKAQSYEQLLIDRSQYIKQEYNSTHQEYNDLVIKELEKLSNIPDNSEVNLWFEDDLFCQSNLWFVLHRFHQINKKNIKLYLIRPLNAFPYSYGHHSNNELIHIYTNRQKLEQLELWSNLWRSYADGNTTTLLQIATQLKSNYTHVRAAEDSHINRLPNNNSDGQPQEFVKNLIKQNPNLSFKQVFIAFQDKFPQYGYGDTQVRKWFDQYQKLV